MDRSLVSNDSIFSNRTGNVSFPRKHALIGLAGALKLDETKNSSDLVNKTAKRNSVITSLLPVNESLVTEKSNDKSGDDNEDQEIINVNYEEHEISYPIDKQEDPNEINLSYVSEPVNQITETNPVIYHPLIEELLDTESNEDEEKEEEKEEDDVKEIKPNDSNEPVNQITEINLVLPHLPVRALQDIEKSDSESDYEEELEDDVMEIITDGSSICCLSDRSNNSFSSFSFPILNNEDGSVQRPYFERSWNVDGKRLELSREETQMRPPPQTRPQSQFYFIPASQMPTHQLPQQSSSSNQVSQTQSQKAVRNKWCSCFCGSF